MHNVLVTGGSRGIGLAIARRLAAAGYNVIAVARSESDALREAIGDVVKRGRGGLHFRAFDLSEIEALLRLNVLSPVILTKYVVRHMMADGAGRIINMSSIIATTGYNGLSVYR